MGSCMFLLVFLCFLFFENAIFVINYGHIQVVIVSNWRPKRDIPSRYLRYIFIQRYSTTMSTLQLFLALSKHQISTPIIQQYQQY